MGFLWGILIVLLLNGLVFPSFNGRRIVETDYGTFIGKVDSGSVKQIMIKNGEIYFTAESGGTRATKCNADPARQGTGPGRRHSPSSLFAVFQRRKSGMLPEKAHER